MTIFRSRLLYFQILIQIEINYIRNNQINPKMANQQSQDFFQANICQQIILFSQYEDAQEKKPPDIIGPQKENYPQQRTNYQLGGSLPLQSKKKKQVWKQAQCRFKKIFVSCFFEFNRFGLFGEAIKNKLSSILKCKNKLKKTNLLQMIIFICKLLDQLKPKQKQWFLNNIKLLISKQQKKDLVEKILFLIQQKQNKLLLLQIWNLDRSSNIDASGYFEEQKFTKRKKQLMSLINRDQQFEEFQEMYEKYEEISYEQIRKLKRYQNY